MSELTIPVQIDNIQHLGDFQRARCNYFRIEFSEGPFTGTYPVSHTDELRIAAWGSWAVLMGPSVRVDDQDLFLSSDSIRETFMRIEETKGLFLDLGYIWLPNQLLGAENKNKDIRIGDVYRLSTRLFQKCYLFVAEMITEEEWLDYCHSFSEEIRPSPGETAAFREWRQKQIQSSYERYHDESYKVRRLKPKRRTE
ncbi:MAG: hypothetical protein OEW23_06575 [Candidatus Aminicenantes bacterium]|nr:hypothetical protein [Candidatus Aminicenantes bacterium]